MKTARKTLVTMLTAAGFAVLSAAALAFPPGAGPGGGPCAYGGGPGMGGAPMMGWSGGPRAGYGPGTMRGAGPGLNAGARLEYLKSELKITSGQEAAWAAYAAQVRQQAEAMTALHARLAAPAQNAPDRFAQRAEAAKQRAAGMEAMGSAVKELYAALTPEQKAIADQHFGGWRTAQAGPRGGPGARGYGPRW